MKKLMIGLLAIMLLSSCNDDMLTEVINDAPKRSDLLQRSNSSSQLYGCDFSVNIGGGVKFSELYQTANGCNFSVNKTQGSEYSEIYKPSDATQIIDNSNVSQFKEIVEGSSPNAVIYIDEDLIIDVSNTIEIPTNVSIVSNRGFSNSRGAQINLISGKAIFKGVKSNSRISGLRLNGNNINKSRAVTGYNVEVDNCDIFNFGNEGIALWGTNNYIHNNFIHDNQGNGYGYGIAVYINAFAKIQSNIFRDNRHHVAGNGKQLCGYEASNNYILQSCDEINTGFDMHHSAHPNVATDPEGEAAGNLILIHHNTFEKVFFSQISLRGIPKNGCFVYNNDFKNSISDQTFLGRPLIHQRNYLGNLFHYNNKYGFNKKSWVAAWGGRGRWHNIDLGNIPFEDIYFIGDFDGNGKHDIATKFKFDFFGDRNFRNVVTNTHNNIDLSPFSATVSDWKYLNDVDIPISQLLFGDFNGNGKTDILKVANDSWQVVWDGRGDWETINSLNAPISQLRLGDFDGNGKTDVLKVADGLWQVSWDGTSSWNTINSSNALISQLLLGDFDGNGKTDILKVTSGSWRVAWNGRGNWETINSLHAPISQLRLGDFDGNGKTDILRVADGLWRVAWDGRGDLQTINSSNAPIESLIFGDFNGDNKTDILSSFSTNIL